MRPFSLLLAALLLLPGLIFTLQGLNILPGSFMTGRPEWAVIGGLMLLAGLALLVLPRRRAP
jgi:LPXTG-motif cell wall-anchored protein